MAPNHFGQKTPQLYSGGGGSIFSMIFPNFKLKFKVFVMTKAVLNRDIPYESNVMIVKQAFFTYFCVAYCRKIAKKGL